MNNDITLLILAAGMGSRFGGLKQIEPIGPNGEFLIDYSIYDAIKAGFNKVVFLIKEENYEIFKETVGSRVEPYINVEYCFQKNDNLPIKVPETRVKPFGTAHAILCCRDKINENFAIISSDDFYGRDAFINVANYLSNSDDFCVVGYKIGETLSDKGAVKRGVCMEENGYLTKVIESKVERKDNHVVCEPLNGNESFNVELDHPVSMILFGLTPKVFNAIEEQMIEYFDGNIDLETAEFLIPDVLDKMIERGQANIKVLDTSSKWFGVTYREDLENVKNTLAEMIGTGEYPNNLWDKDKKKLKVKRG